MTARLTDEEMVAVIWEAGKKYEANGGNLDHITQRLRFKWISQATADHIKADVLGIVKKHATSAYMKSDLVDALEAYFTEKK